MIRTLSNVLIALALASFAAVGVAVGGVHAYGLLKRPGSVFHTKAMAIALSVGAVFSMLSSGALQPHVGAHYPMRDAAEAHRVLEARETVGSTILVP